VTANLLPDYSYDNNNATDAEDADSWIQRLYVSSQIGVIDYCSRIQFCHQIQLLSSRLFSSCCYCYCFTPTEEYAEEQTPHHSFIHQKQHYLAFVSHFCFIFASLFYLKLSFTNISWYQDTHYKYAIPNSVLEEDDDDIWHEWEGGTPTTADDYIGNNNDDDTLEYDDYIIETARRIYNTQYKFYTICGASFFVISGILDWLRYLDWLNICLILAGVAGIFSALADTSHSEFIWEFISNHMYLLEVYPMFKQDYTDKQSNSNTTTITTTTEQQRQYYLFARVGTICFLGGCLLNVLGSYIDLVGFEGLWTLYLDTLASLLWVECAVITMGSEIYFLKFDQ
jgi:hypothetical protein